MDEKEKREMDLERIRVWSETLMTAVWERYKLLPQISALVATLLIVATFREELLPLTNCVRFLIVAFLMLILVSVIGYLIALYQAEEHAKKNLDNVCNGRPTESANQGLFMNYLPWIIAGILVILIAQIIFLILFS